MNRGHGRPRMSVTPLQAKMQNSNTNKESEEEAELAGLVAQCSLLQALGRKEVLRRKEEEIKKQIHAQLRLLGEQLCEKNEQLHADEQHLAELKHMSARQQHLNKLYSELRDIRTQAMTACTSTGGTQCAMQSRMNLLPVIHAVPCLKKCTNQAEVVQSWTNTAEALDTVMRTCLPQPTVGSQLSAPIQEVSNIIPVLEVTRKETEGNEIALRTLLDQALICAALTECEE